MTIIPFYNLIVLPRVTYYFQEDYYKELAKKDAVVGEQVLFLMLQENRQRAEIEAEDFYPIGVLGEIETVDDDGNVGLRAMTRVHTTSVRVTKTKITATYEEIPDIEDIDKKKAAKQFQNIKKTLLQYVSNYQWGMMAREYIVQWDSLAEMVATMSRQLEISNEEKYAILEEDSLTKRNERMEAAIYEFIAVSRVSNEAESQQTEENEKAYREQAIKKQITILQKELDNMHPENVTDVRKFEKKIAESGMNEEARKEADKILNRMKQEGENSHEYGTLYDYLDFVTSLSWKKAPFRDIDLSKAEEILDEEHYGLKKVKQRIIQQIAVMALNKQQSGSILLFVGAPGTGKTSIGQSVAKALNREYVRVSLGGVKDEAEIRGHRRTYVGAMAGRIMEGIKRSGVSNPVVVLDEIDKLSNSYNGDPASALLEVLDPEQNQTFTDHYMNVPYDLSDVLFLCTANSMDTIPEPLLNRMEVIQFQGYTETEKVQIARKHLIPKAMKSTGITSSKLKVTDAALHAIISEYTMEAGVRGLKKHLATLCRIAAVKLVRGEQKSITVGPKKLKEFLDQKPIRHDSILEKKKPGVVTGLAWTQAGGDILFIETMFTKGKGEIKVTGQLGDVMKESVQIAITLVKSRFPEKQQFFAEHDLHIHVPEGAVPKDGPSAGITLTTALTSLVLDRAVSPEIAMTGEVSLRGNVMPIGGLPEKLMAAVRAGIKTVFIPQDNEEDLEDVAEEVKSKLTIIPVHTIDDVLKHTKLKS